MEIIGTNEYEEKRKNKKLMVMITVAIVILLIISIILFLAIYYLKSKQFKFVVDGENISSYSNDLFVFENEDMYVSLKDVATVIGYKFFNGGYKQYTEDLNKCYLECDDEVVTFERDSKKIYKTPVKELDYTYYTLDESITRKNAKLYINAKDLGLACNLQISFDKEANKVIVYTLPYLAKWYTTNYSNSAVESNFNNQKALLYDLMVVQSIENTQEDIDLKDVRYGIVRISDKKEVVGMKYTNVEFIEGTEEFLVTTTENKVGIIKSDGETRVQPLYDALKQIEKDRNYYLATDNKKMGILDKNGKILIHMEYDEIGVDLTQFPKNDIKNRYILFDNAIPVKRDNLWGLYDIDGKLILPIQFKVLGCVSGTSSTRSLNNILVIPDIEGIVVGQEFEVEQNKKVIYYGIYSSTGKEIVRVCLDNIYSITNSGQEEYTMVYKGETIDVLDYVRQWVLPQEKTNTTENTNTVNNTVNENNTANNEVTSNVVNENNIDNNISNNVNKQQTVENVAQPTQGGTIQFVPVQ